MSDDGGLIRVLHLLPDLARGGGQQVVLELVRGQDRDRTEVSVAALAAPDELALRSVAPPA